jgi:hypothetical protein
VTRGKGGLLLVGVGDHRREFVPGERSTIEADDAPRIEDRQARGRQLDRDRYHEEQRRQQEEQRRREDNVEHPLDEQHIAVEITWRKHDFRQVQRIVAECELEVPHAPDQQRFGHDSQADPEIIAVIDHPTQPVAVDRRLDRNDLVHRVMHE